MNKKFGNYLCLSVIFLILGGAFGCLGYGIASGMFFMTGTIISAYRIGWGWVPSLMKVKTRYAIIMVFCCACYPTSITLSQGMIKGTEFFAISAIPTMVRPFQKTASSIKFLVISVKDLIIADKDTDKKQVATKKTVKKVAVEKTAKEQATENCVHWSYVIFAIGFGIAAWKWIRSFSLYFVASTIVLTITSLLTIRWWKNFEDPWTISIVIADVIVISILAYCIWKFGKNPVVT